MTTKPKRQEEGFALVAILFFLLIIVALVTPFYLTVRTNTHLSFNTLKEAQSKIFLDGLLDIGVARLYADTNEQNTNELSSVDRVACGNARLLYNFTFQNHSGLIDLNAAGLPLLTLGGRALGFSQNDARRIAAAITNFRRVNQQSNTISTNVDDTLFGHKEFRFEAVEELFEFAALKQISRSKLHDVFTVHSLRGTVERRNLSHSLQQIFDEIGGNSASFMVDRGFSSQVTTVWATTYDQANLKARRYKIIRVNRRPDGMTLETLVPLQVISSEQRSIALKLDRQQSCREFLGFEVSDSAGEALL